MPSLYTPAPVEWSLFENARGIVLDYFRPRLGERLFQALEDTLSLNELDTWATGYERDMKECKETFHRSSDPAMPNRSIARAIVALYKFVLTKSFAMPELGVNFLELQQPLANLIAEQNNLDLVLEFYKLDTSIVRHGRVSRGLIAKYALGEFDRIRTIQARTGGDSSAIIPAERAAFKARLQEFCASIPEPTLRAAVVADIVDLYHFTKQYFTPAELNALAQDLPDALRMSVLAALDQTPGPRLAQAFRV